MFGKFIKCALTNKKKKLKTIFSEKHQIEAFVDHVENHHNNFKSALSVCSFGRTT